MEKIAIIDLGSNSARLVLVNVHEGGYFAVFDELKESVRLAQDMQNDGFLRPSRVAQTIRTLQMFRRLCDANKVSKIYAFATAAVRSAKNQRGFLDEVQAKCGFRLEVLDAETEAQLVYQGVINSLDVPKGLIMDMGGGSTQFVYYNRKNLIHHATVPYGAINLTDMFKNEELKPSERAQKIADFFKSQLDEIEWIKDVEPETRLVGVGGSFRNLGKISRMIKKYPLDMTHNYVLTRQEFFGVYNNLKTFDLDKTMKIKGLSSVRADIFPSALAAMSALFEIIPFEDMVISGSGLREGAMFRYAVPTTNEKPISDILGHSIYTILNFYNENIKHAEHVYNLSTQLFKQLRVLHKLPRAYVRVLRVASMLHDIGNQIKYYDHHKHSAYIIINSNLYGISHKDLVMSALVVSMHRKGDIDTSLFMKYKDMLTEEDIDAVMKLGVIVRIAESLDRSMSSVINNIACDVLGDSVIMKTDSTNNEECFLEIKDALTAVPEFKKYFKKNLQIL